MSDNKLYENGVIVSLSGGVDSMVILAILLRLKKERETLGKKFQSLLLQSIII